MADGLIPRTTDLGIMMSCFYLEAIGNYGVSAFTLYVMCCFCRIDSYGHEGATHHPNYLQFSAPLLG